MFLFCVTLLYFFCCAIICQFTSLCAPLLCVLLYSTSFHIVLLMFTSFQLTEFNITLSLGYFIYVHPISCHFIGFCFTSLRSTLLYFAVLYFSLPYITLLDFTLLYLGVTLVYIILCFVLYIARVTALCGISFNLFDFIIFKVTADVLAVHSLTLHYFTLYLK